jgi:hypothetical protein
LRLYGEGGGIAPAAYYFAETETDGAAS